MTDDQIIQNAQDRKEFSIAFFNATNNAIELVKGKQIGDREEEKKLVVEIRDFFLEEYTKYYTQVIAKIGVNYNAKETVDKLKTAKTIENFSALFKRQNNMSEDAIMDTLWQFLEETKYKEIAGKLVIEI